LKIYLAHSRIINFIDDLYDPIKGSQDLKKHDFYLPHDNNRESCNDYDFYRQFDLIIAEVSEPSTGLGIELGWANTLKIPILCIYKKGKKVTGSLKSITNDYIEYTSNQDLINNICVYIDNMLL
jgi:nucleoside 2-deoxyribosyltransferase